MLYIFHNPMTVYSNVISNVIYSVKRKVTIVFHCCLSSGCDALIEGGSSLCWNMDNFVFERFSSLTSDMCQ